MTEIHYTSEEQRLSWAALLQLHHLHPHGWTLIGGQMVHLHCWERGTVSSRVTTDADTGLDVRGFPEVAMTWTSTLQDIGFTSSGTTPDGMQHRWVRRDATGFTAQIDVVVPNAIGPRAGSRKTATGGHLLESFGIQQALQRSETISVVLDDIQGSVNRPSLLGALIGKAAALSHVGDDSTRHLEDLLVLSGLLTASDLQVALTRRDLQHLSRALQRVEGQGFVGAATANQARGLRLLRAALNRGA